MAQRKWPPLSEIRHKMDEWFLEAPMFCSFQLFVLATRACVSSTLLGLERNVSATVSSLTFPG